MQAIDSAAWVKADPIVDMFNIISAHQIGIGIHLSDDEFAMRCFIGDLAVAGDNWRR